ncbi:lytic transglycosylase domain-containing protein [Microbacterium sp. SORGH_AS_0888]|uniref:aggregation-promoting factor C-terminal-like domain-containing protein n=1 Tax=Microbacterium sp. SORGH_AS_0888 TaxID=3041791 RepID=UPI00277F1C90|nr:lytic transglycosylase domain-containing protein [Microbacterium sp. SORGH_AS_0888]MDQ1130575.1 hypothetical protein [Microbacterium sp. SORGH_AS_0888]
MLFRSASPSRLRRLVLPVALVAGLGAAAVVSTAAAGVANADPLAGVATATRVSAVSEIDGTASGSDATFGAASGTTSGAASGTTQAALTEARAAVAAAASVGSDIASSGLTVNAPSTTVDTTALQKQIDAIAGSDAKTAVFVPALTEKLSGEVSTVRTEVASLRGAYDAAVAKKASDDAAAAAEAQRQAEAAAAASRAAAASSSSSESSGSSSRASAPAVGPVDPGSAQGIARQMIASYGWGDDQFGCLVALWNRESGWNVYAASSSGAYGIPQALPGSKMSSAGPDWQSNPSTQIAWGLGYISGRYGDACGAWGHSESTGWY